MRIVIGGDVSIKDSWELFDSCQTKELFSDVTEIFNGTDRVIVNLECAVTDKNTPIKKIGPNINAPKNTIKVLKEAGVTDCILSNNHIFDFGKAGALDTIKELEAQGLGYTGFGDNELDSRKDMIINHQGVKIALISVCEHEYSYALKNRMGARPYDPYDTNDDIVKAKESADYVIVTYHGGKENCRYPSPRLLKACRSMIKHGADVVLCQHSHAIGCYEKYMGGHILYGQGNFHFVWKDAEDEKDGGKMWNTGLLVSLEFDSDIKIEFIPTVASGLGIRLAKGNEKEELLSELYERSKSLEDGTWEDMWRDFAEGQERYRAFPNEMYEEIAHYFDCESHTDVCKEIYKTYNHTNERD